MQKELCCAVFLYRDFLNTCFSGYHLYLRYFNCNDQSIMSNFDVTGFDFHVSIPQITVFGEEISI